MSFSYVLSTDVGKLRLEIGDTEQSPDGILPNGRNIQDEEITYIYQREGSFNRAVAALFEIAASKWAKVPTEYRLGPEGESISAYDYYKAQAKEYRSNNGRALAVTVTKTDYAIEEE